MFHTMLCSKCPHAPSAMKRLYYDRRDNSTVINSLLLDFYQAAFFLALEDSDGGQFVKVVVKTKYLDFHNPTFIFDCHGIHFMIVL